MDDSTRRERAEYGVAGAALMAFVTILALLFAGTGWEKARDAIPTTSVPDQPTLNLVGARGDELDFYITGRVLGKTRWRSAKGIFLELEGQRHQVVAPRKKQWGKAITVGNNPGDDLKIRGSFRVPDVPGPERRTVIGVITGTMTSAQPSSSGFWNRTDTLRTPVRLQLVSSKEAAAERAARQGPGQQRLRLCLYIAAASIGLGICSGVYSWYSYRKLRPPR